MSSRSESSLGIGSSKTRRTIAPVHLCRSFCDERPSTRRPDQSENLALAFNGANTRSRSRPPIFRGDSANVESANRRRMSGHNAVSRRTAISSGSGASNTTTGFAFSRKSASSSSLALKAGAGGSRSSNCSSSSMRTALISGGSSFEQSWRRIEMSGGLRDQIRASINTLLVRTQPARGTVRSCQVLATT
ncbi:hypothetical protein D3C85_1264780 [compost metagenome]